MSVPAPPPPPAEVALQLVMRAMLPVYYVSLVLTSAAVVPLLVWSAVAESWPALGAAVVAMIFCSRGVGSLINAGKSAGLSSFAAALAQARAMAGAKEQG